MSAAELSDAPRRREGVKAEINVTPLVDVVLVLLIIFMVVTPQLESGAAVELPKAKNPDEKANSLEPLTVSLTKGGDLYFDKEKVGGEVLVEKLKALHASKPDVRLVLKADREAPYGKVRSIFKTCQDLEFPGISLQVIDQAKN